LIFVRYAVSRFIEAGLVFAHGTTDPVAEAAFLVCETLHLHPDQFEMFATARVTSAEAKKILDVIGRRISTRKPAAYLVNKIYMRRLPFYVASARSYRAPSSANCWTPISAATATTTTARWSTIPWASRACWTSAPARAALPSLPRAPSRMPHRCGGHVPRRPRCRRPQCCRLRACRQGDVASG